jgi:hypothetical protein
MKSTLKLGRKIVIMLPVFDPDRARMERRACISHVADSEFSTMLTRLTRLVAIGLTLTIAACATTPPPAVDMNPPPRKAADAKTQLESGKKY